MSLFEWLKHALCVGKPKPKRKTRGAFRASGKGRKRRSYRNLPKFGDRFRGK